MAFSMSPCPHPRLQVSHIVSDLIDKHADMVCVFKDNAGQFFRGHGGMLFKTCGCNGIGITAGEQYQKAIFS